jgi:sugar lactone lactonase YvrE
VREECLYWVDIQGSCFYRYRPATGEHERFVVGVWVGALALREGGGLVLATQTGFAYWDDKTHKIDFFNHPEQHIPTNRFNDGKVDRQGRFWAGTMEDDSTTAKGSLYRLDIDHSIHKMETDLWISNGIGWSPDNTTMYLTDSIPCVIYAYDFEPESGQISNRRDLIKGDPNGPVPDGMTVDSEGYIWSAQWGGWKIVRYAPDGTVDREIAVPVAQPSCVTFGGADLSELYITSAWKGLSEDERKAQPLAGDIFRIKPGVRGLPEPEYKG